MRNLGFWGKTRPRVCLAEFVPTPSLLRMWFSQSSFPGCFNRCKTSQFELESNQTATALITFHVFSSACTLNLNLHTIESYPGYEHNTTVVVNGVVWLNGMSGTVNIAIGSNYINTISISIVNGQNLLPENVIVVEANLIP